VPYSRLHRFKNIVVDDLSFGLRPNSMAMDLELLEVGGSAEGGERQTHVQVTKLRCRIMNLCRKRVSGCSTNRSSNLRLRTRCVRCSVYLHV